MTRGVESNLKRPVYRLVLNVNNVEYNTNQFFIFPFYLLSVPVQSGNYVSYKLIQWHVEECPVVSSVTEWV
jgi:hypothetical protein